MQDKIELLIFDMDGTLIDSSKVICNSINHVRDRLNLKPLKNEEILKVVNDMHTHSPSYFYEADEFTQDHIEWFQDYYTNNHQKEVALYSGIETLLDELKDRYILSIATNAYRVSALQILSHLHIDKKFDLIVCADDVKNSKPEPDMIEYILKYFNLSPSQALMIGDSLKDKEAAKRAGVETILVDWGFSDLSGALKDIGELRELLL